MKLLVAVDGSSESLLAVSHVIKQSGMFGQNPSVELVYVHVPLPYSGRVKGVVGSDAIESYYKDEGTTALAGAERALAEARIEYRAHILVGAVAESIVEFAKEKSCDLIVVGTRGTGNLMLGSVTTKILHIADRPVLVVK